MGGPVPPDEEDDGGLGEQVMVAALPDATPEVHVASLRPEKGLLVLRSAAVAGVGEVMLGNATTIDLKKAGSVVTNDGVVAVLGKDSKLMVQMHLETTEELDAWTKAIKLVIRQLQGAAGEEPGRALRNLRSPAGPASPAASHREKEAESIPGSGRPSPKRASAPVAPQSQQGKPAAEQDNEDEVVLLRARSRQLQTKIATLEAMSEKRDKHHSTVMTRLDGAMQMMEAVQAMCSQQCKVIDAQKVALAELSAEAGAQVQEETDSDRDAEEASPASPGQTPGGAAEKSDVGQRMMSLMEQAEAMQHALSQLEALGAAGLLGEDS